MVKPIFLFDSQEQWFPVGVEESLRASKASLVLSTGSRCDLATAHADYAWWNEAKGVRLDFPKEMRHPASLPPVVYNRTQKGGGLVWDQYWLWYLYNPKNYAGVGKHEGDWEFVQIGYVGEQPVLMTCSQHHTGGKREFWNVQLRESDKRPVVYVARDSHANYFAPVQNIEDVADGRGKILADYEVRPFWPWASWGGRWGNSTGEGQSPQSPGQQGARWSKPHIYHSRSR